MRKYLEHCRSPWKFLLFFQLAIEFTFQLSHCHTGSFLQFCSFTFVLLFITIIPKYNLPEFGPNCRPKKVRANISTWKQKDPAPVTQKHDILIKVFQKFVKYQFFGTKSESANRFSEFCFNNLLTVTVSQKKIPKKQLLSHFQILNSVENNYGCQKPKNPI